MVQISQTRTLILLYDTVFMKFGVARGSSDTNETLALAVHGIVNLPSHFDDCRPIAIPITGYMAADSRP